MADVACKVACGGVDVVKNVCKLVHTAKENDELCLRIVERTEALKPILEDLQLQATSAQLPSNIETAITALQKALDKCKSFMTKLDERVLAEQRQYHQSQSCHFQLTGLYDELTAATNTLTLAIYLPSSANILKT